MTLRTIASRCPTSPTEDHVPCIENFLLAWTHTPDSLCLNGRTFRHAICCHCLTCYVIPEAEVYAIEAEARRRGIEHQGPQS